MMSIWAFALLMCYILIGSVVVSIAIMIVGVGVIEVRKRWPEEGYGKARLP